MKNIIIYDYYNTYKNKPCREEGHSTNGKGNEENRMQKEKELILAPI